MPLRRAAPRKPRKATIVIGVPTMARRTDSSTAIMKQIVTSRRLPAAKEADSKKRSKSGSGRSLNALKKEQKKIKKILRDDSLSSEAKQHRINKIYNGSSSCKRKHHNYSSSSSSSDYSSDSD
jgi:hypothetical protein